MIGGDLERKLRYPHSERHSGLGFFVRDLDGCVVRAHDLVAAKGQGAVLCDQHDLAVCGRAPPWDVIKEDRSPKAADSSRGHACKLGGVCERCRVHNVAGPANKLGEDTPDRVWREIHLAGSVPVHPTGNRMTGNPHSRTRDDLAARIH